jgi:hypothetical protein
LIISLDSTKSDDEIPKNPFLLAKSMQSIAGEVKSLKRLRDGNLLVECDTQKQSRSLLNTTIFAGKQVEIQPHRTLNTCKGVIRDRDRVLQNVPEQEIVDGFSNQGVKHVKRIIIKRNGDTIQTNTYILTFNSAKVPVQIKAGFNIMRVEVYIPNALRCYKCQRYGHGTSTCTNRSHCFRCGDDTHEGSDCKLAPKCINCSGQHMASSKECPVWIRESKITRLKHEKNISFKEARQLVMSSSTSYSSAVKSSATKPTITSSVGCQTVQTWVDGVNPVPLKQTYPAERLMCPSKKVLKSTTSTQVSSQSTKSSTVPNSKISSSPSRRSPTPPKSTSKPEVDSRRSRAPKPTGPKSTSRPRKGEEDPIATFNRYDSLGDMEVDEPPPPRRAKSSSPNQNGRRRSPVKPPDSK